MSNCCSHGTLLHFSLQSSHLNICYYHQDLHQRLIRSGFLDREESYIRIIDGQVRCITQEHLPKSGQLIWNVEFVTVFVPAWMIPTIYYNLRRECIKNAAHPHEYEVRSVRPTWFEDWKMPPKQDAWLATSYQGGCLAARTVASSLPGHRTTKDSQQLTPGMANKQ